MNIKYSEQNYSKTQPNTKFFSKRKRNMKIQLDWNRQQVSELTIHNLFQKNGTVMKCQTTLKSSGKTVDTRMSSESFLVIQSMIKQSFSQQQIRQEIYEELKISSLGETLTIRDRIKGGGCGSSSVRHPINTAIIQEQKKETQARNKEKAALLGFSQVSNLSNEMKKIIDEPDSEISDGKIYMIDTIFPIIDKDGAIKFQALHPQLLKILMKGFNLLLRDNVKSKNGFIWTSLDKTKMEEALNNILQRIKSIEKQEPLLIHCFCISMIRDMLNTKKSSFDALNEAIAFGVPLFGLLWNQDPTLLLQLALKAKSMILEKLTENTMQSMMKYQAKALAEINNPDSQKEKEKARLLFAYQSALDGVIGKKNNESWEVQVFAMMQINEVLKQMLVDEEQINDSSAKWKEFFDDPSIGLIEMCKQQASSFRGYVLIQLLDRHFFNNKTIRFMALEILTHVVKLLNLQKEKSEHKQIVLKQIKYILFQRWLLETEDQVRTLFMQEDVLNVIDELVKSLQNEQSSEASNLQKSIVEDIKKEKEALELLKTKKEEKYEDSEVEKELQDVSDILVQISSEGGMKEVIKLRQVQHYWKTDILKRRAKGDIQKDDALLDTIECYVGQFIKKKEFIKVDASKGNQKDHQKDKENYEQEQEESIQEIEALDYLLNLCKEKNEKSKMCVMVGSGGRGKSMLLKKLELELLEDLSKGNGISKYDTLPIIIKLFELDPENPNILEYLQNQPIFKEQRLDPSVLRSSTQQKVLLLDAFDEFRGPEFNLWENLMLEDWVNTTVVVTCRDDALTYDSCNRIFSTPHGTKDIPSFTIHELMGFGEEQLKMFADSLLKEKNYKELFKEIIHGDDYLIRLLSLPINALIFIRTIPSLTKSSAQTLNLTNQGDLQQLFYQNTFEREAQMIFTIESESSFIPQVIQEYFSLFQKIAVAMFSKKTSELTQEDLNKAKYFTLKPSLKDKLSATQSDALQAALKKYSNGSILVLDEDRQTVRFVHLSIFEFFVARSIVAEFESLPPKSLHELSLEQIQALSISSRYIVERGDSSGLAILQKISRMIKPTILSAEFLRSIQSPTLTDHHNYIQLILLSRQENFGRLIDTAASNMLSILAYTKCPLVGLNLSRCSLTKAYLYGYNGDIDLSSADLNEAMLSCCGLDLSRSKTEKAQFSEVQSTWQSRDIYSFSSCCLVTNSKAGQLTLVTGSKTGFFNIFSIDLNFKKQPTANYSNYSQFAWKLIKSKRLSSEKILNIRHINNTFILSQKRHIVQLDENGDILFTFMPHTTDIKYLNYQLSLKHLVTVGEQGDIKIWDVADQFKNINTFENVHAKIVICVQFSSAEPYYLVSSFNNWTCGVWQYSLEKKNWFFQYFITGFAVNVDRVDFIGTGSSQLLLTNFPYQGISLWSLQQDKAELFKRQDLFQGNYNLLYVSPDGKILVAIAQDSKAIQFYSDMMDDNCQIIFSIEIRHSYNQDYQFSTDSKFFAIMLDATSIYIIGSVDNKYQEIAIVNAQQDAIENLAITKSTSVLATVSQKECLFWMRSADSANTSFILAGKVDLNYEEQFYSKVCQMSISDLIGNGESGEKYYLALSFQRISAIQIYEIGLKKSTLQVELLQSLQIQENQFADSLGFYENVLLAASDNGCIAWDSQNQFKEFFKITTQKQVYFVAMRKNNGVFFPILATKDNSLEIWQLENKSPAECIKTIALGDAKFFRITLASSPDNKYLAALSEDNICKIFSMEKDFSLVATLKLNQFNRFSRIVFSADSLRLATRSDDDLITIWLVNSNFQQELAFTDKNMSFNKAVLFLPDNSKKFIASNSNHLILWDFQSTYPTVSGARGYQGFYSKLACSPSGQFIIISDRMSCSIWINPHSLISVESNFEHYCTFKQEQIRSINFISENSFVCCCYGNEMRIYKIIGTNVNLVQTFTNDPESNLTLMVSSAETSSKKQYIATYSGNKRCQIYVAQNEQQDQQTALRNPSQFKYLKTIQKQSKINAIYMEFSPQAKYFIIGLITGRFIFYDSSTEAFELIFFLDGIQQKDLNLSSSRNYYFCVSPDNLTLSVAYGRHCILWDIQTQQILLTLAHNQDISYVNYFKDGSNQLAILVNNTSFFIYKSTSEGLQLADTKTIKQQDVFKFGENFQFVNFLGSSEILAIVSQESFKIFQTSRLFQTTLKQQLPSPHSKSITNITFSSDGKCIAMASEDKTCSLWKITENNSLEHCQTFQLSANSLSLLTDQTSTSPGIKLLSISNNDKTVQLYQAQSINESMSKIRELSLPSKPISKFALQSSNNNHSLILLQSKDCVILNHIGENLSIQQTFSDIKLAAVNSTSTFFSLLKSDGLQILDSSLNILQTIPLVSQPQNNYVSLTISTDDRFIVLTDSYQNITLFSTASPYEQIPTANKYPMAVLANNMTNRSQENSYQILSTCFNQNQSSFRLMHTDLLAFQPDKSLLRLKASKEASLTIVADKQNIFFYVPQDIVNIQTI